MDEKITVEASAELEQVIAHAEAGEEVEITRNGAVVARLWRGWWRRHRD